MPFSQLQIEKLYGGKAHVGLRILDPDTGSVSINGDGSWVCEGQHGHRSQHYPDPLLHVSKFCTVLVIIEVKACQFPSGRK
ncbi:uncharacterized protein LOC123205063 isoform X2 [Mangifera indica]|uniref:uncharacterized protein LOC123205063 isoform X2 n=1 Tax=Mangifera indica TaxID=29780 RepID=UPI001CF947DA|nr:uncharacterized protein LOC123205063 isoform X2 [Mangifera indica]